MIKRKWFLKCLLFTVTVFLVFGLIPGVAVADGDTHARGVTDRSDHRIAKKWDMEGSFIGHSSYNFPRETLVYDIHIKEAVNEGYSVGSIYFVSVSALDKEISGRITGMKNNYGYWLKYSLPDNFALVGIATYQGEKYNFILLYHTSAIQLTLSTESYEEVWEDEILWPPGAKRAVDIHSGVSAGQFTHEPKIIH